MKMEKALHAVINNHLIEELLTSHSVMMATMWQRDRTPLDIDLQPFEDQLIPTDNLFALGDRLAATFPEMINSECPTFRVKIGIRGTNTVVATLGICDMQDYRAIVTQGQSAEGVDEFVESLMKGRTTYEKREIVMWAYFSKPDTE